MEIRRATLTDLDEITSLQVESMLDDPQWTWRFSKQAEYPQDTYDHSREHWRAAFEKPQHYVCIVACTESDDATKASKIVGCARWDITNVYNQEHDTNIVPADLTPPADRLNRRDADATRIVSYAATLTASKERFFHEFRSNNIYLMTIATHVDHRRQGAGRLMTEWGIDLARRHEMAVVTFGSPLGVCLYTSLGFRLLGWQSYRLQGDENEDLQIAAMALPYEK